MKTIAKFFKLLLIFMCAGVLAACGGGGGSSGVIPGSTIPSTTATSTVTTVVSTATLSVKDFVLYTDKSSMKNNGTDKITVTAVALDSARNVVSGSNVKITTDQNSVFTPSSSATTDASGIYSGILTIGDDKTDRNITLEATINGIVKRTTVKIVGSKLILQINPTSPVPGQTVTLVATITDANDIALSNSKIILSGSISSVNGLSFFSDSNGGVKTSFVAPQIPGSYTVNATGSGVTSVDYPIQVLAPSGAIPPVVFPLNALPSLAATPNVLSVNPSGSSANKSVLKFLFLDSQNSPVKNARVRFDDLTTGLPLVGASIGTGGTTIYTDSSGVALSQYISGQNTSPTNGVLIRACYSNADFLSDKDCPNSVATSLTVAGQALAVSIGDDNLLSNGAGGGTYIKKFVITVADSAGKAIANAPVDISVDLTHYGKGPYTSIAPTTPALGTSTVQLFGVTVTKSVNPLVTATVNFRAWCRNEDANRNGFVDPGENEDGSLDTAGQATLQPRKSDLIISYADPAVTVTNKSGILIVQAEYSQRFATWLNYVMRVTANVGGSQGNNERAFVTSFIVGDDVNGSFLVPPYGYNGCATPN